MTKKKIGPEVKHCWSILCKKSTLDSESNDLSLISVVDRIDCKVAQEVVEESKKTNTKGFLIPVDLEVVTKFKKNLDGKAVAFDYRFRLYNPKGGQMGTFNGGRLAMDEKIRNLRVRVKLPFMPIDREAGNGDYGIGIDIKDVTDTDEEYREVERIPLEVVWSINSNK